MAKYKRKDEWEEKFQKWRKDRKPQEEPKKEPPKIKQKPIIQKEEPESHQALTRILTYLAFIIPALILIYAFYINYLPFGWEKSYELTIDDGIISPLSKEIYLTDSQGKRLLALEDGINGQVNLVIEPSVVLKNATLSVKLEGGEDVYLATPMKTDLSRISWDILWNFKTRVPSDLEGTAEYNYKEECTYFDAVKEQTLYLPNSADLFESGPMSVYVKWKPSEKSEILGNYQQLIGHYNWEIWQGEDKIQFRVGRMNDKDGPSHSVNYPITSEFFEEEHELLAIYSPSQYFGNGYIELWIDGNFAERTSIASDIIWDGYGSKDLTLGWTPHNYEKNPHFDGCIYDVKILNQVIDNKKTFDLLNIENSQISIPIVGEGNLNSISIDISQ